MSNELIIWSPGMTIEHVERLVILKAYSFYKNNKTTTAAALGISIRTLDERLKKYGHDDATLEARAQAQSNRDRAWDLRSRGLGPAQTPASAKPVVEESAGDDSESGSGESVHEVDREQDEQGEELSDSAERGDDVESASDVSEKPTMPLHVGKKVQSVSSRKASASRARR